MNNLKNLKIIAGGFIAGSLFFSGVSYAADQGVNLTAFFGVKLIHNGIDKTPADSKPFIVNGTTYVPLRTAAELTGAEVSWDGKSRAVTIGRVIEGIPLPSPSEVEKSEADVEFTITENKEMFINQKSYGNKGQMLHTDSVGSGNVTVSYDLNAEYRKFAFSIGVDDKTLESTGDSETIRTIIIKDQDGTLLKQITVGKGSIQEAVEIDVTGVVRLDIQISNLDIYDVYVDLINPVLIK